MDGCSAQFVSNHFSIHLCWKNWYFNYWVGVSKLRLELERASSFFGLWVSGSVSSSAGLSDLALQHQKSLICKFNVWSYNVQKIGPGLFQDLGLCNAGLALRPGLGPWLDPALPSILFISSDWSENCSWKIITFSFERKRLIQFLLLFRNMKVFKML